MNEKYTDAAGIVAAEHIADRNVGQLDFTKEALERAGARGRAPHPGGGMLSSTHDLLNQILETEKKLRHDLEETDRQLQRAHADLQKLGFELDRKVEELNAERTARQHLEGVVRNVADAVVNGRKAAGT